MARRHRATGNPRGRPRQIPVDIGDLILKALARRVDPETGLVQPLWRKLAKEVGVSRATLARQLAELKRRGAFDVVLTRKDPDQVITYYRLKPQTS